MRCHLPPKCSRTGKHPFTVFHINVLSTMLIYTLVLPICFCLAARACFSSRSLASPRAQGRGRAKYVLLLLPAFPCLSPRWGEVSRSDGEGPRAGGSVVAPLRRYRASSPLALRRGRAKRVRSIKNLRQIRSFRIHRRFVLVDFGITSRSRWPWSRAGREP